jgi:septal ring factor EnvC (AmiA/AmiB activator)
VQRVYAQPLADVSHSLNQSQQETSKIKSNLTEVKTEKEQLATAVQEKDTKIQQLEQENSELKE